MKLRLTYIKQDNLQKSLPAVEKMKARGFDEWLW